MKVSHPPSQAVTPGGPGVSIRSAGAGRAPGASHPVRPWLGLEAHQIPWHHKVPGNVEGAGNPEGPGAFKGELRRGRIRPLAEADSDS